MNQFNIAKQKLNSSVKLMNLRSVYGHYKYSDLTAHEGMVYVPYQVSVMSLFEQYRMNIPMFFPSLDLLAEWQLKHHVMNERTWAMVHGRVSRGSPLPGLYPGVPDPNSETNATAIKYWIKYADFYQWPNIIYYDSAEDLVRKMRSTDLKDISEKMKIYNKEFKRTLEGKWSEILTRVAAHSQNHPH